MIDGVIVAKPIIPILNNFLFDWKISEDSINGRITLKPIRKPEA